MARTWAMAIVMRLVGNVKGMNVRVAGNKEGEGSKAMAMVMMTRMAGEWSATATKRSMAMATRVAGKQH